MEKFAWELCIHVQSSTVAKETSVVTLVNETCITNYSNEFLNFRGLNAIFVFSLFNRPRIL